MSSTVLMHKKFAQRLAVNVRAKRKASGVAAAEAWWREVFPRVSKEQVQQVVMYLKQMPG